MATSYVIKHIIRWYQKLLLFCKIFNKQSPIYLLNIIPVSSRSSFTRYVENVPFLKWSFYFNWIEQDSQKYTKITQSLNIFKKSFEIYTCHNTKGIKLITRLRVGLSHLRKLRTLLIRYAIATETLKLHLIAVFTV